LNKCYQKVEILERELNYQLKVYRGKTQKYEEIKQELKFYKFLYLIILLKIKYQIN